jgi:hypothetical protein
MIALIASPSWGYGGQEVRDGVMLRYRAGAGRRGQAYGNDGSSGTDEDFSDHERSRCSPSVYLNDVHSSYAEHLKYT